MQRDRRRVAGKVVEVSGRDPRHGRRDNGLVAAEYAAAGDVDPRVGEHLLDVLALDGIAAFLRPTTDLNPVTRSSTLPDRPTDRLFVDRTHLSTAREYLARLAAEASTGDDPARRATPAEGGDLDDAWAQIVAGYHRTATDATPSWPAAEDVTTEDGPAEGRREEPGDDRWGAGPAPAERTARRTWASPPGGEPEEPSLLDALDTFGADLPDEDDEGFTPPPAPPVPRPSLPTILGVAGISGGLVVFLRPDLLPLAQGTTMLLGFAACVAGVGTIVWRLRPGDDEDDDPDDGARV
jgi:hypothetical protein